LLVADINPYFASNNDVEDGNDDVGNDGELDICIGVD